MVNLIAAVVSLALIAVTSMAGIYYGGEVFSAAGGKARASQLIQTLQQINLAWIAYDNDGGTLPTITKLATNGTYLSASPNGISGLTTCLAADVTAATCTAITLSTHYQVDSAGAVPGAYIIIDGGTNPALAQSVCIEVERYGGQATTNAIVAGAAIPVLQGAGGTNNFATIFPASVRVGCGQFLGTGLGLADGLNIQAADAPGVNPNYIIFYKH